MPISPALLDAVIHQESRGDPAALNKRTGAAGIAQIMPDTARQPGYGVKPISLGDRYKPEKAVPFAEAYLSALSDKYKGNVANTLAAYNWGPGNVDKWLKSGKTFSDLPSETRNYIMTIMGNRGAAPTVSRQYVNPEVRGYMRRADLSDVPSENIDDMLEIFADRAKREAKSAKAAETAASKARSTEAARIAKQKALFRNIGRGAGPGVGVNARAASVGSPGRPPRLQAANVAPVSAPIADPMVAQQGLTQSILNTGGLLGSVPQPVGLLGQRQRR